MSPLNNLPAYWFLEIGLAVFGQAFFWKISAELANLQSLEVHS